MLKEIYDFINVLQVDSVQFTLDKDMNALNIILEKKDDSVHVKFKQGFQALALKQFINESIIVEDILRKYNNGIETIEINQILKNISFPDISVPDKTEIDFKMEYRCRIADNDCCEVKSKNNPELQCKNIAEWYDNESKKYLCTKCHDNLTNKEGWQNGRFKRINLNENKDEFTIGKKEEVNG